MWVGVAKESKLSSFGIGRNLVSKQCKKVARWKWLKKDDDSSGSSSSRATRVVKMESKLAQDKL